MGLFGETVERKGDQASPSLLDLSVSLTKAWVTEDPITLQDSSPPVTDRAAFTAVDEAGAGAGVGEAEELLQLYH